MNRWICFFLFLNLITASQAGDLDNWYFEFLKPGAMSVGWNYFPNSDEHTSVSFYDEQCHELKDEGKFIVNGVFSFKGSDYKDPYTVIYSKVKESQYQMILTFQSGTTGKGTLILKDEKTFENNGTYSNQTWFSIKGGLKPDGKLYSNDSMKDKDGNILWTSKVISEKKPLPQKPD